MDIIKSVKCIICLAKCSKYLYFAKKMLCIVTVLVSASMLLGLLCGRKGAVERLKGIM